MINKIYYIIFIFGVLFSSPAKIDINSGSYEDIMSLPLLIEKNNEIWTFLNSSGKITTIYDLLIIPQINIKDIHILKDYIKITDKKYNFPLNKMIGP